MRCSKALIGDTFHCSDDNHEHEDGLYEVMSVNEKKKCALIKNDNCRKAHWVSARNLYKPEIKNG